MAEQQEEVRQGLSDKISDLENFYADSVLGDELKELYAEVQMKCIDFRTNVFMKNLEHLDEKFVSVYFYEYYREYSIGKKCCIRIRWGI